MSVMELFTKLFDLGRLPSKIVAWVLFVTGAILFAPAGFLAKLHLDTFASNYGLYLGVAFLASAALLGINIFVWLSHRVRSVLRHRRWHASLRETLAHLDPSEQAVLREFFLHNKSTLKMPVDDPAVAGLYSRGVLRPVSQLGEASMVGMLLPFSIDSDARRLLTPLLLGFPNGQPTEIDRQHIIEARPRFTKRLEKLGWLRNG